MDLQAIRAHAERVAVRAGDAVMPLFNQLHEETIKSSLRDVVTEGDRAAEAVILADLTLSFPEFGIISEESGAANLDGAAFCWHIDPIDGTTNFAANLPFFSISIALADAAGRPLVGVVCNPCYGEVFSAARGFGATLNSAPIHVSKVRDMGRAVLCSGFSTRRHEAAFQADLRGWSLFLDYCRDMRRFGSAALELAFVGAGRLDGYWERNLRTWDVLAGICIAQEAGATVSDYQGDEALLYNAREIVASNGIIHGDMLRLLARIKGTEAPANGG